MAHPSLMLNGEAPWGVTEERAEGSDVFAHNANGELGYMRAGTPRRMATQEVSALVGTFQGSNREDDCDGDSPLRSSADTARPSVSRSKGLASTDCGPMRRSTAFISA